MNVVEGCKLIEDVYLIEEKNFFQKKFYVGESGNWIITNKLITKKIKNFLLAQNDPNRLKHGEMYFLEKLRKFFT